MEASDISPLLPNQTAMLKVNRKRGSFEVYGFENSSILKSKSSYIYSRYRYFEEIMLSLLFDISCTKDTRHT